jgi:ribonucleoside-triphosphate reductase
MRKLEDIDKDLEAARQELSNVKGRTTEVYSRIVGYYRSVRNWNKGKREEYGERRLYDVEASTARAENCVPINIFEPAGNDEPRILLFVREGCPACPSAKAVAGKLGVPVGTVDTASEDGLAEAARRNVMSTPTVILLDKNGNELSRAHDVVGIASLNRFLPDTPEYKNAASM